MQKEFQNAIKGEISRGLAFANPMSRSLTEDGKGKFVGEAVVFNRWSENLGGFKEIIYSGAIGSHTKYNRCVAVFQHREDYLLGKYSAGTLRFDLTNSGLSVEIDEAETTISRDCGVWVERKEIDGMSFKFTIDWDSSERSESPASKLVYNENDDIYEHHIYRIGEILDVSLVVRQAYSSTSVELSRNMSLNDLLKANEVIQRSPKEIQRDLDLVNRAKERKKFNI